MKVACCKLEGEYDNPVKFFVASPKHTAGMVGLMAAFIVEFLINGVFMQLTTNSWWQQNLLPSYGIIMLLCGLAAGILGLVAVIR
jgi:hypothetical protein